MERLTKKYRNDSGTAISKEPLINRETNGINDYCSRIITKLADYEDLEDNGLLLRLPCKVGDTVWCIYEKYTKCSENEQEFDEYSCQGCECLECDSRKEHYVQSQKAYSLDWIVSNLNRFGKTVFLMQAEAEQKLKEMDGDHGIAE